MVFRFSPRNWLHVWRFLGDLPGEHQFVRLSGVSRSPCPRPWPSKGVKSVCLLWPAESGSDGRATHSCGGNLGKGSIEVNSADEKIVPITSIVTRLSGYKRSPITESVQKLLRIDHELVSWLHERDPERRIVVKPNWIQQSHESQPEIWEPVITHPTVVLAVIEGLAELMGGVGTISVCDAPHTHADFEVITRRGDLYNQLEVIRGRFRSLKIEVIDFRREVWLRRKGVIVERSGNPGDLRGYVSVDLSRDSLLYGMGRDCCFYGADYDTSVVNLHHAGMVHEYLVASTAIGCDLFVNVPKLKTHKKTGITCCLKNLVGINGDKNWLPHHREGTPKVGGDEFPDDRFANVLEGKAKTIGRRIALAIPVIGTRLFGMMRGLGQHVLGDSEVVIRNGNWSGNDTCWRMALDLNRALLYSNADGTWRDRGPRKRYLAIVDGIIGGEGNGPAAPDAVASGVLIGGTDPAAVDAVACRLMGFNPAEIPIVAHAFDRHRWPIASCRLSEVTAWDDRCDTEVPLFCIEPALSRSFRPHFGWACLQEIAAHASETEC